MEVGRTAGRTMRLPVRLRPIAVELIAQVDGARRNIYFVPLVRARYSTTAAASFAFIGAL